MIVLDKKIPFYRAFLFMSIYISIVLVYCIFELTKNAILILSN